MPDLNNPQPKRQSARALALLLLCSVATGACGETFEQATIHNDMATDSGTDGDSDGDDTTAGTTVDPTTQGPGDPSSSSSDDDDDDDDDTEPVDAPPTICNFTVNGQDEVLSVQSPKKLNLSLCAEDDEALKRVELLHNGELWHAFDFELDEYKTEFQTTISVPAFSQALNGSHDFELRVYDHDDLAAAPETVDVIVALPGVADENDVDVFWTHSYENDEHDPWGSEYRDLVVDDEGNTFAVGYWISSMDEQTRHALLVKIPKSGGPQLCAAWNFLVGQGISSSQAYGVDLTSDGDVIVVGASEKDDGGLQSRMWIRKFDSDCQLDDTWVVNDDGDTHSYALDVAVAPNDAIYVVGYRGVFGYSMSPLIQKYQVGTPLPTAELADPQDWYKDHSAVGVDYDDERKLVFVTGSVTSGGPLDERMMLMVLKPALDQPQATHVFADDQPSLHSEGIGVRVRADGSLLVAGNYRDGINYGRAAIWRYEYDDINAPDTFTQSGTPILLKKSYGPGDEVATGVDVSPEVPFIGNNEWAVSLYTYTNTDEDGDTLTRGVAERRAIDDSKQWQYVPQPIARFQSVALDCSGRTYVAGSWKIDDPPTRPQAIVHKLP